MIKLKLFSKEWNNDIFIHDLRKPLPWKSNNVDIIYSSHTLEHLTKEQGKKILKECHRILKKDGILRIIVPDLRKIVDNYISGEIQADEFFDKLGVINDYEGNKLKSRLACLFGFPHRCMYDDEGLLTVLEDAGFKGELRNPFESEIVDISAIELDSRTKNSVIVECQKKNIPSDKKLN